MIQSLHSLIRESIFSQLAFFSVEIDLAYESSFEQEKTFFTPSVFYAMLIGEEKEKERALREKCEMPLQKKVPFYYLFHLLLSLFPRRFSFVKEKNWMQPPLQQD